MDANAAWKKEDGVDFLPELNEIRYRIQVGTHVRVGRGGRASLSVLLVSVCTPTLPSAPD